MLFLERRESTYIKQSGLFKFVGIQVWVWFIICSLWVSRWWFFNRLFRKEINIGSKTKWQRKLMWYKIVWLGGNLCVYLWICCNTNEYVWICPNLWRFVRICVDLYGSMWICTKLHGTMLICVHLYWSVLICAILCESVRMWVDLYGSVWICTMLHYSVRISTIP